MLKSTTKSTKGEYKYMRNFLKLVISNLAPSEFLLYPIPSMFDSIDNPISFVEKDTP